MKNTMVDQQTNPTRWLLMLFLCFSLFTFSSAISSVHAEQNHVVQTELLINKRPQRLEDVVSRVKQTLAKLPVYNTQIHLIEYSKQVKVNYNTLQQALYCFPKKRFLLRRINPQNSDEDTYSIVWR